MLLCRSDFAPYLLLASGKANPPLHHHCCDLPNLTPRSQHPLLQDPLDTCQDSSHTFCVGFTTCQVEMQRVHDTVRACLRWMGQHTPLSGPACGGWGNTPHSTTSSSRMSSISPQQDSELTELQSAASAPRGLRTPTHCSSSNALNRPESTWVDATFTKLVARRNWMNGPG